MPRLEDVRAFFRRQRRPLDIDLAETQAGGLASVLTERGTAAGASSPHPPHPPHSSHVPRRRVGSTAIARPAEQAAPERVADALVRQAEASERIAERLDRIVPVAQSIADMNRRVTGLAELISDLAARAEKGRKSNSLSQSELLRSIEQQSTALGLLHERMIADGERDAEHAAIMESLRHALSDQASSNANVAAVLTAMRESSAHEASARISMQKLMHRWMIMMAASASVAILTSTAALLIIALG